MTIEIYEGLEQVPRRPPRRVGAGALIRKKEKVIRGFRESQLKGYVAASPELKAKILHFVTVMGMRERFLAALSEFLNPKATKSSYRRGRAS